MNDRLLSSWILVTGAIGFGYYYYRLVNKTTSVAKGDTTPGPPVLKGIVSGDARSPLARLLDFAASLGLPVTSTTGGRHARGSLHYQGRAIDVGIGGSSVKDVTSAAEGQGFRVLNEMYSGMGEYGFSSGPHLHIEVPVQRSSLDIDGGESTLALQVG